MKTSTVRFSKKHNVVAALLLAPILLLIVCLTLVSCTPQDINYNDAISIAKQDFGCEKVSWIDSGALLLKEKAGEGPSVIKMYSHYAYYVVGEKDGKEIYIIVPSRPDLEKAYTTSWALDHTFAQIVEKFNENGAQYVADVSGDYYSVHIGNIIDFIVNKDTIAYLAEYYYNVDNFDSFYERLDIKAVFEYRWEKDGKEHRCMVTQENGELKSYASIIVKNILITH